MSVALGTIRDTKRLWTDGGERLLEEKTQGRSRDVDIRAILLPSVHQRETVTWMSAHVDFIITAQTTRTAFATVVYGRPLGFVRAAVVNVS